MNSLRRRLILLLVISIVGVVGLATAAVISVRGGGPPPELTVPWVAEQMELVMRLLNDQLYAIAKRQRKGSR